MGTNVSIHQRLKELLFLIGAAELFYDGYTAYTEEEEEGSFYMCVQLGAMPPHWSRSGMTWDQLIAEVETLPTIPPYNWTPAIPE